jgi:hypothetical protein
MRSIARWAAVGIAAVLVLPLTAADEKKVDPKKDIDKPVVNTEKTVKAGQISGRVAAIVESKKSLRLQLTFQYLDINQGAANGIAASQIRLAAALARRDAAAAANEQVYMAQQQANLYVAKKITKDVEISTTEDVKVRLSNPPPKFDDKGKLVRYTQKELKELKGDSNLPGYSGEFSDLAADQIVAVTLVRKKDAPKPAVKPKGKDADTDLLQDNLPQASMIVVVYDPNAARAGK